jgi:hypothetical protein
MVHFGGFPAQAFNIQGGAPHIGYQSQKMANTHGAQIVATNKLPLKQNNIYLQQTGKSKMKSAGQGLFSGGGKPGNTQVHS